MLSVIIFIISLAILILVHEFGHFIVAKKSGIRVDEFGLGFPPKVWGKKYNGTEYTLNAIPFGGFVKIFGEDPHSETISDADRATSFYYKPKWIQAAVLVAGITMNILFAWVLMSAGYMIGLPAPIDHVGPGVVQDAHLVVINTLPGSPAELAGLKSGDTIVSVSSKSSELTGAALEPDALSKFVNESDGALEVTYSRGKNPTETIEVIPNADVVAGKRAMGIGMDMVGTLKLPVYLALYEGAKTTISLTAQTAVGLVQFFGNIFTFHTDLSQVSGPVGIAGSVAQARSLGFVYLLSLVALISINLAVINLIPFPALDGGRLLFVIIESISRKRINRTFVQWANTIGFLLLLALMVVITGHDIFKLL